MRRAVLAILGTAAGTTLLVGLKAFSDSTDPIAAAQSEAQPAAPPADAARGGADPSRSGAAGVGAGAGAAQPGAKASGSGPASKPAGAPGAPRDGRFNGRTVQTPYGPVTVTISVAGGRITAVDAKLPTAGESREHSARAAPQLRQQTLARQSAKVDTVSGSTYTSEGYRQSLQAAIDQAKRG